MSSRSIHVVPAKAGTHNHDWRCFATWLRHYPAALLGTVVMGPRLRGDDNMSILRRLLAVGVALRGACENLLGDQPGILPDRGLDLARHVGVGLEERFGVLAALAETLAVIGEPGAGFFD